MTRLRRPIVPETLEGIGTLVILTPMQDLGKHELDALKDWIEDGHALVVVPGSSFSFAPDGDSERRGRISPVWINGSP